MRIRTQGALSVGDKVTRNFGSQPRDWSGLQDLRIAVKQDQPTSAVQWRVRFFDTRGASASALLPVSATNQWVQSSIPFGAFVPEPATASETPSQPNLVRVSKLQFELVTGSVAASSWFDNIVVNSFFEGEVLDTLMAVHGSAVDPNAISPIMTYYHGHTFPKPFTYTGFAPWMFRRVQCTQLFDFVLNSLWGLSRTGGMALRASAPSLRSRPGTTTNPSGGIRSPWGTTRTTPPRGGIRGTSLRDPASRERGR
jgi:hypothetical protein